MRFVIVTGSPAFLPDGSLNTHVEAPKRRAKAVRDARKIRDGGQSCILFEQRPNGDWKPVSLTKPYIDAPYGVGHNSTEILPSGSMREMRVGVYNRRGEKING